MADRDSRGSSTVYLDNAATSWPKPPEVIEAILHYQRTVGANPGRSGHRMAVEAGRIVNEARENISILFNAKDPLRVVLTCNATEAINLALRGILEPGGHVVTDSMEHNSVMRPLRDLEELGLELTVVRCSDRGRLNPDLVREAVRDNTRMIVINHASNVTGTLAPIREIGRIARESDLLLLVDAAQTAGSYPLNIQEDLVDLLAFTGHKSMMGPQGTGGLIFGERVDISSFTPLRTGGTGSRSEHEKQPGFLPDLCESGTPNTPGIAGLNAGVLFVLDRGVAAIRKHEMFLAENLLRGLQRIPSVTTYGPDKSEERIATVSFNVGDLPPSEIGLRLDEEYDIMCRVGLHCAPSVHRTIGTFPSGTVRFGIGFFNTEEHIGLALEAIDEIAAEA